MGLDYCRLDLLLWLFATTSSQGPLPLDQWGYLLRLFQGDFHSRQGIKQTADSPVPMMACLFTLCHAQMSHIFTSNRQHTNMSQVQMKQKGPGNLLCVLNKEGKEPHFTKRKQTKEIERQVMFTQIISLVTRSKIILVKNLLNGHTSNNALSAFPWFLINVLF